MRVTADLWVSALVRRVFAQGGYAAVLQRGAGEAGAIFVMLRPRRGEIVLYGPAPQASYDEARPGERQFQEIARDEDEGRLQDRLERERRFDPDLWIVEIEAEHGEADALIGSVTKP